MTWGHHIRWQQFIKFALYGGELIIHDRMRVTLVTVKYSPPNRIEYRITFPESRALTAVVGDLTSMGHYRPVSAGLLDIEETGSSFRGASNIHDSKINPPAILFLTSQRN